MLAHNQFKGIFYSFLSYIMFSTNSNPFLIKNFFFFAVSRQHACMQKMQVFVSSFKVRETSTRPSMRSKKIATLHLNHIHSTHIQRTYYNIFFFRQPHRNHLQFVVANYCTLHKIKKHSSIYHPSHNTTNQTRSNNRKRKKSILLVHPGVKQFLGILVVYSTI